MKFGFLLLSIVLNAVAAFGQLAAAGPESGVSVLKHSWSKERVAWDDADPIMPGGVSTTPRSRKPKTDEYRKKEASEQRSMQLNASTQKEPPEDTRFLFTYEIVVNNGSSKTIREIDWDYVFIDTETREEIGRRQFTSVEKIGAGKKKKLAIRVHTPPTRTVKVSQSGKKDAAGVTEAIEVHRILYDDDSEWRATPGN